MPGSGLAVAGGHRRPTVSPITERPVSGLAPNYERAASFLAMGLLFGFGYSKRWLVTVGMVIASGFAIEALQYLTPDRHPALADALVKSGAGTIGILIGATFERHVVKDGH
jgi:VanZ family protein